MAGSNAFGTRLERFNGEDFAAIARLTSLSPPSLSRNTTDVTAHDSPEAWEEHLGTTKSGGEVSADVNYSPEIHDVLTADFNDPEPRSYRVVYPSGATWTFDGILTGFDPDAPHDDKLEASLTWQTSGIVDTGHTVS